MKLENLVVSKETALKLKEIGFPQDTCFYHHECYLEAGEPKFYTIEDKKQMWYSGASCHKPIAAAPTSAELTKYIPLFIESTSSHSEVECKAKLIIQLIKDNCISFDCLCGLFDVMPFFSIYIFSFQIINQLYNE